MNTPPGLRFSESDEWVRVEGDTATVGISDYAQHELGEIVYLELPETGASVAPNVAFGVVESVKAVSELLSPIGGEVVAANTPLTDDPSIINNSPYDEGWLIKVRIADAAQLDELMDDESYGKYRQLDSHE